MRGRMSAYGFVLLAALAAAMTGLGCGDDVSEATLQVEETTESFEANPPPPFRKLAVCPVATGQTNGPTGTGQTTGPSAAGLAVMNAIVCGKNGVTYSSICAAGGTPIAHEGGCADFVCNGVVCAAGSTCRAPSGPGTPYHCVAD